MTRTNYLNFGVFVYPLEIVMAMRMSVKATSLDCVHISAHSPMAVGGQDVCICLPCLSIRTDHQILLTKTVYLNGIYDEVQYMQEITCLVLFIVETAQLLKS